ncbi:hypothetical protein HMPREF0091_10340 [Fannyhessea vaginae DSM 15829]|uniref:Uncharacterized protein n=1 Tax=Fannyhessea vaginae DSM 15829 TaxID=525256 RepID=F1T3U9_9ACTN|nr:hypothetical protein HMPREF0091_10340 [Fannyhessea vaginae DSM 15829]
MRILFVCKMYKLGKKILIFFLVCLTFGGFFGTLTISSQTR